MTFFWVRCLTEQRYEVLIFCQVVDHLPNPGHHSLYSRDINEKNAAPENDFSGIGRPDAQMSPSEESKA